VLEQAEAYRAQVINQAEGEASRFTAVLGEYEKAPDVTRKRLYLETIEQVLGRIDKVIIDENTGGQGVVPYLPLNELGRKAQPAAGTTTGGTN
jgi:modulator of FtsH protease HflK